MSEIIDGFLFIADAHKIYRTWHVPAGELRDRTACGRHFEHPVLRRADEPYLARDSHCRRCGKVWDRYRSAWAGATRGDTPESADGAS